MGDKPAGSDPPKKVSHPGEPSTSSTAPPSARSLVRSLTGTEYKRSRLSEVSRSVKPGLVERAMSEMLPRLSEGSDDQPFDPVLQRKAVRAGPPVSDPTSCNLGCFQLHLLNGYPASLATAPRMLDKLFQNRVLRNAHVQLQKWDAFRRPTVNRHWLHNLTGAAREKRHSRHKCPHCRKQMLRRSRPASPCLHATTDGSQARQCQRSPRRMP